MKFRIAMLFVPLLLALCAACSRAPSSTADIPRLMPRSWQVTVAPFTQPLTPAQLISGSIPIEQGKVAEKTLRALDRDLRGVLQASSERSYVFLPDDALPENWNAGISSGQPSAFGRWLEYGRRHGASHLLVPQVLDWHEREGSEAGVTKSAHARLEFFLIDVNANQAQGRSIFEEKQVGLIDNLLAIGDFMRRRGKWVSANELAIDGMKKAVRELGL